MNHLTPTAVVVAPNHSMPSAIRKFVHPTRMADPINVDVAYEEYNAFCTVLGEQGVRVVRLSECNRFREATAHLADIVYPEDSGRNFQNEVGCVFVSARMTPESRKEEPEHVVPALQRNGLLRPEEVRYLEGPGIRFEAGDAFYFTLSGNRHVCFGGCSKRSNYEAYTALSALLNQESANGHLSGSWEVRPVTVRENCLHLTSGSNRLGPDTVLCDPALVDTHEFYGIGLRVITVHNDEAGLVNSGNCLYVPTTGVVLMDQDFPKTIRKVESHGIPVIAMRNRMHGNTDGGMSCRVSCFNWHR